MVGPVLHDQGIWDLGFEAGLGKCRAIARNTSSWTSRVPKITGHPAIILGSRPVILCSKPFSWALWRSRYLTKKRRARTKALPPHVVPKPERLLDNPSRGSAGGCLPNDCTEVKTTSSQKSSGGLRNLEPYQ